MRKTFGLLLMVFVMPLLAETTGVGRGDPLPVQAEAPAPLPKSWLQRRQREPVFNSDLFWIEAGPKRARSVLLVHGLGQGGLRTLEPVITALQRDYRVIALDLPGFGQSGQPAGRYSPVNYARVLNWLLGELDLDSAAIFGHSMGGAVALRFAASYPERVERLILVSVAGILERTAFLQHMASLPMDLDGVPQSLQAGADTLRQLGGLLVNWSALLPDPTTVLPSNGWIWKTFVEDQPNVNAAFSLVQEDFSDAIAKVEADTYIILGTSDPLSPPRTGRLLAGQIASAQLLEMMGADHMPMYTETALFTELLRQAMTSDDVGEPFWQRPKWVWKAPDLKCDQERGIRYSGYYRRIKLNGCDNVLLENVSAESIELTHSSAEIYNLQIRPGREVAMTLNSSQLQLTNAEIRADTAIVSNISQLDLAGVKLKVDETAVIGNGDNRLILSVSRLTSPGFDGYVHGNFRLLDTTLDVQLQ